MEKKRHNKEQENNQNNMYRETKLNKQPGPSLNTGSMDQVHQ